MLCAFPASIVTLGLIITIDYANIVFTRETDELVWIKDGWMAESPTGQNEHHSPEAPDPEGPRRLQITFAASTFWLFDKFAHLFASLKYNIN